MSRQNLEHESSNRSSQEVNSSRPSQLNLNAFSTELDRDDYELSSSPEKRKQQATTLMLKEEQEKQQQEQKKKQQQQQQKEEKKQEKKYESNKNKKHEPFASPVSENIQSNNNAASSFPSNSNDNNNNNNNNPNRKEVGNAVRLQLAEQLEKGSKLPTLLVDLLLHNALDTNDHYRRVESVRHLTASESNSTWTGNVFSCCTHTTLVPDGQLGKFRDGDVYFFAKPGYSAYSRFGCEFFGLCSTNLVNAPVVNGSSGFVTVTEGNLLILPVSSRYVLLPHGVYEWSSSAVVSRNISIVDITENPVAKLGPMTLITVPSGMCALTYFAGELQILGAEKNYNSSYSAAAAANKLEKKAKQQKEGEKPKFFPVTKEKEADSKKSRQKQEQEELGVLSPGQDNNNNEQLLGQFSQASFALQPIPKSQQQKQQQQEQEGEDEEEQDSPMLHHTLFLQQTLESAGAVSFDGRCFFLHDAQFEFSSFLPLKDQLLPIEDFKSLLTQDNVEINLKALSHFRVYNPTIATQLLGDNKQEIFSKVNQLIKSTVARVVASTKISHHGDSAGVVVGATTNPNSSSSSSSKKPQQRQEEEEEPKQKVNPFLHFDDSVDSFTLPSPGVSQRQQQLKQEVEQQEEEKQKQADLSRLMSSSTAVKHIGELKVTLFALGIDLLGVYIPERKMLNDEVRISVAKQAVIAIQSEAERSAADAKAYSEITKAKARARAILDIAKAHSQAGKDLGQPQTTSARLSLTESVAESLQSANVTVFQGAGGAGGNGCPPLMITHDVTPPQHNQKITRRRPQITQNQQPRQQQQQQQQQRTQVRQNNNVFSQPQAQQQHSTQHHQQQSHQHQQHHAVSEKSRQAFRTRLELFYTCYAPDQYSKIEDAVQKFAHQEDHVFSLIANKYKIPVSETTIPALRRKLNSIMAGGGNSSSSEPAFFDDDDDEN